MTPREAGRALERANPLSREEEESWAATEEGRKILSDLLAHPLASLPTGAHRRASLLATAAVVLLAALVVGVLGSQVALRKSVDSPAEVGVVLSLDTPRATVRPTDSTDPHGPDRAPSAVGLEAIAAGSREILSVTVTDIALMSGSGHVELEVAVLEVLKGEREPGRTVQIVVPVTRETEAAPDSSLAGPGDRLSSADLLVGRRLIVTTFGSPADSVERGATLGGYYEAYVLREGRLDRLGYFLAGRPDPEAPMIGDLRAALSAVEGTK